MFAFEHEILEFQKSLTAEDLEDQEAVLSMEEWKDILDIATMLAEKGVLRQKERERARERDRNQTDRAPYAREDTWKTL